MNDQNPNNTQIPQQSQQPQSSGRKPDHGAYNVQNSKQGKAIWNRIGSAWRHNDGQGFEIDLHSMPVNGRVTVRELRDQAHQHYDQQAQSNHDQTQQQSHDQRHSQNHDLTNTHGRSR